MKKLSEFIVSRRRWLLGIMIVLALGSVFLYLQVKVNYDMTKYLPDDSAMKQGLDIMEEEFPSLGADKTIRVMATGLNEEKQAELLEKLKAIPNVESVAHDSSEKYHQGEYSLFVISTACEYGSPDELAIERTLEKDFQEYHVVAKNDNPGGEIPVTLLIIGVSLVIFILVVMCKSWFEPVLFLINIGIAVVINEGTNIILGEVSYITSSLAAVLQLVLSVDYSVMLLNRYRQEKEGGLEKHEAMTAALRNCFSSIAGSGLTTAVGLVALVFMHFKIGMDLGIVLAKGVLLSLICSLTVLPALMIPGDRLITKTAKKAPRFPMTRLAHFSYRWRYVLVCVFVVCFVVFYFLQGGTQIAYTLTKVDPIVEIFPSENPLVLVYENKDEQRMAELEKELKAQEGVTQVMGYPGLFGTAYTAEELAGVLESFSGSMGADSGEAVNFDPSMLKLVYSFRFMGSAQPESEQKMTIPELFEYVNNLMNLPVVGNMITPEIREAVTGAREKLDSGMRMLKSDAWSRMVVYTTLPVESEETEALMNRLEDVKKDLTGEYYIIGNSAMSHEMQKTFSGELQTITLLTAAAIFLIVLITSRSVIVPAILVLIVQCGVYITITAVGWQGYSIYYLALLIVECVLMGATIDYGILFTGYYRENRKHLDSRGALEAAYNGSIHSIMTSGLILILVTGVFGYLYSDPTVAEICRTISMGALSAVLVILLLLPGILSALDRLIVRRKQPCSGEKH